MKEKKKIYSGKNIQVNSLEVEKGLHNGYSAISIKGRNRFGEELRKAQRNMRKGFYMIEN
mgnify:CR=1 FL=1|tara:strand:+ start:134 stop:313 length:180 start_codon:yes stop_codon:yes gene_type:complete